MREGRGDGARRLAVPSSVTHFALRILAVLHLVPERIQLLQPCLVDIQPALGGELLDAFEAADELVVGTVERE